MLMDNFNLLLEKPQGFVSFCDCCQTFQIAFGNIALTKGEKEFLRMIKTLTDIKECHAPEEKENHKTIWLPTALEDVQFIFTLNEIKSMLNLAEQAYLIYKAEQLINQ